MGPKKGLAVTSLVLGIFSVLGCVVLGSLAAIVTGAVAVSKANSQPGVYGGKGLAIAGIVMGALSFVVVPLLALLVPIYSGVVGSLFGGLF
jgi:hypothetical protein